MSKVSNKQIGVLLICLFANFMFSQLPFMDNKRNLCLLNCDKIETSFYQVFKTQNVIFGNFTHKGNFHDAVFLDNAYNKILIAPNSGSVSLPQFSNTMIPVYSHPNCNIGNIVGGNFNGDIYKDLAIINSTGDILAFESTNGINYFKDSIGNTLTSNGFSGKLFVTNNDNSNYDDLISIGAHSSPNGYYFQVQKNTSANSGTLSFAGGSSGYIKTTTNVPSSPFDATSIDINKDGYDEIVFITGSNDSVTIMINILGNLATRFSFGAALPNLQHKRIKSMDINNDGNKEIAVLGKLGALNYVHIYSPTYSNSIPTGLNVQKTVPVFYDVNDFIFSDLNKDGLSDLVLNSAANNSVMVYMQDKTSLFNFDNTPIAFGTPTNHISQGLTNYDVDDNKRDEVVSFATGTLSSMVILRNFTYLDSLKAVSSKTAVCPGDTVVLRNRINEYFFSYISSFSPTNALSDPDHILKVTSPTLAAVSSTYTTFFVTFAPCVVSSNTVAVVAGIVPSITLTAPPNICQNTTATISANGASSYTWSTGNVNTPVVTVTPSTTLTYYVSGRGQDGCIGSKSGTIGVYPDFTASVTSDKTSICKNKTAVLTASGGSSYIWTTGQTTPKITVTQTLSTPQTYSVYVTDANGCSKLTSYSTVFSDGCTEVTVKNGITLNNDGKNDYLYIENIESYPNNKVMVFNRWGVELCNLIGYDNADKSWPKAGEAPGLTAGTYYFIVDLGNGETPQKGWLEIIRN